MSGNSILSEIDKIGKNITLATNLSQNEEYPEAILNSFGPNNIVNKKAEFLNSIARIRNALEDHRKTRHEIYKEFDQSQVNRNVENSNDDKDKRKSVNLEDEQYTISFYNEYDSILLIVEQGLSYYEEETNKPQESTTLTLYGEIFVLDIFLDENGNAAKASVTYATEDGHNGKIDTLLLKYLENYQLDKFEINVTSLAHQDWQSRGLKIGYFTKSIKVYERLKDQVNKDSKITRSDIVEAANFKNGLVLTNSGYQGTSLVFRIPPVIYTPLSDGELIDISKDKVDNHWSYKYMQLMWFGWESRPHLNFNETHQSEKDPLHSGIATNVASNTTNPESILVQDNNVKSNYMMDITNSDGLGEIPVGQKVGGNDRTGNILSLSERSDFEGLVARLEPYIWCSSATINSLNTAVTSKNKSNSELYFDGLGNNDIYSVSPVSASEGSTLEWLASRDSMTSEYPRSNQLYCSKCIPGTEMELAFECLKPSIQAFSLCRIPLTEPEHVFDILPIIRRQLVFNELIASCFSSNRNISENVNSMTLLTRYHINIETNPKYPFSLLICVSYVHPPATAFYSNNSKPDDDSGSLGIFKDKEEMKELPKICDEILLNVGINGVISSSVLRKSNGELDNEKMDVVEPVGIAFDKDDVSVKLLESVCNNTCDIPTTLAKWIKIRSE
ncbi:hypothetical protein BB558_005423 [Smittium angustum]|uniref:Mediator of RNA polymerase II transcription subunit 1 n=1 Tax=Smittium angustum TaxID=133377 RepID=A0A2U1J0J7_SMIAN|nr:hypothetical protein BB558_005423 [Smittium angustum]